MMPRRGYQGIQFLSPLLFVCHGRIILHFQELPRWKAPFARR